MNALPAGSIVHGMCGSHWAGSRTAHCGRCHRTFSSTTAFDRHWREPFTACLDPETVADLVPVPKKWGTCWSCPSDGNPYARTLVDAEAGA